jgi:ABC-type protease/lipase transport system fused ATPase/permease subunit
MLRGLTVAAGAVQLLSKELKAGAILALRQHQCAPPWQARRQATCGNITAHAVSGRVLAIMGPSAAGKTTLLNGLSGRAVYAKAGAHLSLFAQILFGCMCCILHVCQWQRQHVVWSIESHKLLV